MCCLDPAGLQVNNLAAYRNLARLDLSKNRIERIEVGLRRPFLLYLPWTSSLQPDLMAPVPLSGPFR